RIQLARRSGIGNRHPRGPAQWVVIGFHGIVVARGLSLFLLCDVHPAQPVQRAARIGRRSRPVEVERTLARGAWRREIGERSDRAGGVGGGSWTPEVRVGKTPSRGPQVGIGGGGLDAPG